MFSNKVDGIQLPLPFSKNISEPSILGTHLKMIDGNLQKVLEKKKAVSPGLRMLLLLFQVKRFDSF